MKQTIQLSQFVDAFRNMGRAEQFSYDALTCLFDYLTELETDLGEEIELDVIGLCCEFSEDTPADIAQAYNYNIEGLDDDEGYKAGAVAKVLRNIQAVIKQAEKS